MRLARREQELATRLSAFGSMPCLMDAASLARSTPGHWEWVGINRLACKARRACPSAPSSCLAGASSYLGGERLQALARLRARERPCQRSERDAGRRHMLRVHVSAPHGPWAWQKEATRAAPRGMIEWTARSLVLVKRRRSRTPRSVEMKRRGGRASYKLEVKSYFLR